MLLRSLCLLVVCLSSVQVCLAQHSVNFPHLGEVLKFDDQLDQVLPEGAKIEVITSGYDWTEGPLWVPEKKGYLLFADIPRNSVYRWDEGKGASLFMKPSGYTGVEDYGAEPGCNGITLSPQGELVFCEHGDRRISVLTKKGGKRTLVDNYQGKRLNSPNDVVFHSNGDLYFTDPPYGLPKRWDDPRRELDFCGVYRLTPQGELTLLTDSLDRPNGLAFSPDEKTLYVAQSDPAAAHWTAFPVKDDGTLDKGRVFHDATKEVKSLPGLPDGMKVAQDGTIFATGPGGVYIFNADHKLIGRISTGERTSNCAFGGPKGDILYLTADTYVCRIQTKVVGVSHKK